MEINDTYDKLHNILARRDFYVRRGAPVAHSAAEIEKELRRRRKLYLGSHVSLRTLLEVDDCVDDEAIDALAHHLSDQTIPYWHHRDDEAKRFCYQFYRLALFGLLYGGVRECADDIIQLCSALVRSRAVFRIAEQELLPPHMFGELFEFLEDADDAYFTVHFEDAVLYAVASFMGAIERENTRLDPAESEEY